MLCLVSGTEPRKNEKSLAMTYSDDMSLEDFLAWNAACIVSSNGHPLAVGEYVVGGNPDAADAENGDLGDEDFGRVIALHSEEHTATVSWLRGGQTTVPGNWLRFVSEELPEGHRALGIGGDL